MERDKLIALFIKIRLSDNRYKYYKETGNTYYFDSDDNFAFNTNKYGHLFYYNKNFRFKKWTQVDGIGEDPSMFKYDLLGLIACKITKGE